MFDSISFDIVKSSCNKCGMQYEQFPPIIHSEYYEIIESEFFPCKNCEDGKVYLLTSRWKKWPDEF